MTLHYNESQDLSPPVPVCENATTFGKPRVSIMVLAIVVTLCKYYETRPMSYMSNPGHFLYRVFRTGGPVDTVVLFIIVADGPSAL